MKKEKKLIKPNEMPFGRWLFILLLSVVAGFIVVLPFEFTVKPYMENNGITIMGLTYQHLSCTLFFLPFFAITALFLKLIGKTSMKDFILGVGGTINKQDCITVFSLYLIGIAAQFLLIANQIGIRSDVRIGEYIFLVVFMILTAWIQTTCEELLFRGFLLRWACKNKVGYTKKAIFAAIINAVIFAIFHMANPEVTSQNGIFILISALSYAFVGFMLFLADLHFGNMLPGIIIHLMNNFTLYSIISSDGSAAPTRTFLVDNSSTNAVMTLISHLIAYSPILVYIIVDIRKRKKAGSVNAQ